MWRLISKPLNKFSIQVKASVDFQRYINQLYRTVKINEKEKNIWFVSNRDQNKNQLILQINLFDSSAQYLDVETVRRIFHLLIFFDVNVQKKSDFLINNIISQLLNSSISNFFEFYMNFTSSGHILKLFNHEKFEILDNFASIFERKDLIQKFSTDQAKIFLDFVFGIINENFSLLDKKKLNSISSHIYNNYLFLFVDQFDDSNLNFLNDIHFLIEKKVFAILAKGNQKLFIEKFKTQEDLKNIVQYSKFLYKFCFISENSIDYKEYEIFNMVKKILNNNFGCNILNMLPTSKEILNFGDLISFYMSKNELKIDEIDKILTFLGEEMSINYSKKFSDLKGVFRHIFVNLFRLDEQSLLFCISLEINEKLPSSKFISYLYHQYVAYKLKNQQNNKKLPLVDLLNVIKSKIHPRKVPIIFYLLQPLINEYIDNENNMRQLSNNLSKILTFKTMGSVDNLNLYLALDKKLVDLVKGKISIPWEYEYFNFFLKSEHLYLERFYRIVQDNLIQIAHTMKFGNFDKNLYLINHQVSTINLLPIIHLYFANFKTDSLKTYINSGTLSNLYFLTANLLNFQLIEKISFELLKTILERAKILLRSTNLKIALEKSLILNVFIIKHLYPKTKDVYLEEFNEIFKNGLQNDYTFKVNRFHCSIREIFLKCCPGLKYRENFTIIDNHFECDFYLEEKQILIEFLGPKHFNQEKEIILGTQRILDLKKKLYGKVVLINCYEWSDMSEKEQLQYVQNILNIN